MFRRILLALAVLLFPLAAVTATSAAGASVGSPQGVAAHPAASTAAVVQQPTLRLGSHGSAVKTLQQRLIALHYRHAPRRCAARSGAGRR